MKNSTVLRFISSLKNESNADSHWNKNYKRAEKKQDANLFPRSKNKSKLLMQSYPWVYQLDSRCGGQDISEKKNRELHSL